MIRALDASLEGWKFDDDDDDEGGNKDKNGGSKLDNKMLKARTIVCAEQVSDSLYRRVATMITLLEHEDNKAPITVYVNSPGGSADSGFAIYDLLRFTPCPVRTVANGMVASSAVLIYLAADEGQRYALPNSRFLLHQPSTFARGQASDIDITAREIVKLRERYNAICERHTGQPVARISKDAERDFWLSSQEALEYGMVNKVVEKKTELPK